MQTKMSWKMAEALWRRCDSNSGIMAVKWGDNSLVNLASNFVRVEPIGESRKWREKEKGEKKTFHVLKLLNNTTKAWEVWTWWTCCYHCIKYCARQSASTKRYSSISSIRQRSMLGSYTVITFVRMENHIKIRNLCWRFQFRLSYQML